MAQLILVRHGQSLWNALNKFTGWVDVPLSERGRAEATIASCRLSGYRVNVCFTSKLIRAITYGRLRQRNINHLSDRT